MLYVTTSTGVYAYDPDTDRTELILGNRHTRGWFRRRARGYFGICRHPESDLIVVASRERLGTRRHNKPTTDVILHGIKPGSGCATVIAEVPDVHDVHQIAIHGNTAVLTDTGKNRLVMIELDSGARVELNVGTERDDVNHINAVRVLDGKLLVGLNNRGYRGAQVLEIPTQTLAMAPGAKLDADRLGTCKPAGDVLHTHDIEPAGDDLYACASHEGCVFSLRTGDRKAKVGDWTRGLAVSPQGLWVGASQKASRRKRHSQKLSGKLVLYRLSDWQPLRQVSLQHAGQVNDLLFLG